MGGQRLPSVTEVLDPLLELDGIPKHVLKAAAEFGTHVHMACDLFDKGVLDEPALDPHLVPYLNAWKQFLHDSGAVVLASEVRVHHPRYEFAGTLDKIVTYRRQRVQIDLKSGDVPRTVGPQTAAYEAAHNYTADRSDVMRVRYALQLRPDATYRLIKLTDARDIHIFLSALNLHRWRNE